MAQETNYEKQIIFSLPFNNVEDISYSDNSIYIKTIDSLYIISKNGKIKEKKRANNKYFIFQELKSFTLDKNIITDETNKVVINLADKYDKEKKITKYLAKAGDTFYTCLLDTPKISYSSSIIKIDIDSKTAIFSYIVGIPSGLYSDGEFLWYLYNKSVENKNGMLRIFDIKTGILISENEVPVINPVGIYVKDNQLFTYSNFSGEFIQLKGGQ
jgi:hypothetical protein